MALPDALDLKVMQALQLDGRASFVRIAEVLGVSDKTVARRVLRLRRDTGLRVTGMTDETRLGRPSWIVRLRCTPDAAEPLATALARRADTSYIGVMSGGTEVMCAMRPRTQQERDELLLGRPPRTPRVVSVHAHCVLNLFYGGPLSHLNKISALSPAQEAALRPEPGEPPATPVALDAVDEALIGVLRRDGRAPMAELQSRSGQSEAVVKRRLDRLRGTGILYFDVEYDQEPLGHGTAAMLWLTVAPSALVTVGNALAAHPEVRFAAAVSGRENAVASVHCRDTPHLYTYLTDGIGALSGVQHVETALTLRQVRR
ncbi:AsnC family transcriptional regulator [Streptomyces sp. AM 2-1-1]|uniref:Lrp/AsnC family transcriptional regulator n=1 Tax=unclassified Streptomyces TaxID=2593676 RepID=UPI0023B918C0|nr:AsnC family transcriptional regulator [Streptomyces sp. AM 2-1-1]WEH39279.1 AsnC family transcriptional regulator [Streptomyces sp. AM 2-1-1]